MSAQAAVPDRVPSPGGGMTAVPTLSIPPVDVHGGSRLTCPLAAGVLNALVLVVPFWFGVIAWLT